MIIQTTLRPGQKGTKALVRKYGDRPVCVRYRYDRETGRRCTTVELIEAETAPKPKSRPAETAPPEPRPQRLGVRVHYWESDLRRQVKEAGGIWRPRHKLWELQYDDVVALGLESRVVATDLADA
ncbi:hypothetical protein Thimo_2571 [Thioflavicoccus mobilis 8321]|uniref:Uncharacterized protein n=2 Tax=Thioflavicoccus mobilis TaxID=80679 RepID=L0H0Y3_9GAMM|nr:hypothetical protein Thimo_2571 [Thioflavicoccus mobilis 8321]